MASDTSAAVPAPTVRQGIEVSATLRRHRVEAARWALANGRALGLDALSLILVTRATRNGGDPRSIRFRTWTRPDVARLVWTDAAQRCHEAGVELPEGTAETLWTYLSFLHDTGRLRGDGLAALQAELAGTAGLDRAGRLRHPSGRGRSTLGEVRAFRQHPQIPTPKKFST